MRRDGVRFTESRTAGGQALYHAREAQDEALAWIHWYNQTRMHSTLGYVSPAQFEISSSDEEKQNGREKGENKKRFSPFPPVTTTTVPKC